MVVRFAVCDALRQEDADHKEHDHRMPWDNFGTRSGKTPQFSPTSTKTEKISSHGISCCYALCGVAGSCWIIPGSHEVRGSIPRSSTR